MKSTATLALFFILLTTPSTFAGIFTTLNPQCLPSRNNCDFYQQCLEQSKTCGEQGYALNYGDHYCRKFLAIEPSLTAKGQQFLQETRACLQGQLQQNLTNSTQLRCERIEKLAFASHPYCYTSGKNSICFLDPIRDLPIIFAEYEMSDLFTLNSAIQMRDVAAICIVQISQKMLNLNWGLSAQIRAENQAQLDFWISKEQDLSR